MESTAFLTFCGEISSGPGIIWCTIWGSFAVQFGGHLRFGDHLRAGIICGPVQHFKPCIRLARLKFESANQDSTDGENSTVLTNTKWIDISQLFSVEMALDIHEKGLTIAKTILDCKK